MAQRSISQALKLGPEAVGPAIAALAEDQWFDRKSARENAAGLAISEVAMANAEGGTLVVGIHNGVVEGTERYAKRRNELTQAAIDHTEPPVRVSCNLVPCINEAGEADNLLVIDIDPSEVVHVTKKDECYLRVGDEDRRLRFTQRQELIYDKGQAHFDALTLPDVDMNDLDPDQVQHYLDTVNGSDTRRTLQARLLISRTGQLTAAGYLLFGCSPQDHFPEAYVRVLRYRGTERETGRRQTLTEDIRCEGPIPGIIEKAAQEVERLAPSRQVLGQGNRFVRESLIPRDAWLEGIVNAIVHRSYSIGGDHIRVEIFDNRIEIHSPGRFPGVVGIEDPRGVARFARNPRIARACADLKYGQELGEGIRRIFDEMRTAGLIDPVYQQTPVAVRLVLVATALNAELAAKLPERSREVMELIRNEGALSTGDIAEAIDMSKPATLRRLNALKDVGLLDWTGKSAKDPRAVWRLKSD